MSVTNKRFKPLVFETTESGCFVPTSHKLDHEGYFHYRIPNPKGGRGTKKKFHRFVWEDLHGREIPEGYEIDHMCNNRACQNINHLQVLTSSEHARVTVFRIYGERRQQAYEYWLEHRCTGTALGEHFGVSKSTAYNWIQNWKLTGGING